jgi:hypothetical protein
LKRERYEPDDPPASEVSGLLYPPKIEASIANMPIMARRMSLGLFKLRLLYLHIAHVHRAYDHAPLSVVYAYRHVTDTLGE